jgi:hypothetical protein
MVTNNTGLSATRWQKVKAAVATFLAVSACTIAVFFLIEGFCSSLLVIRKIHDNVVISKSSRYSTQFDKQLGWANIPNYYQKNYFNSGVYVKINSQGFRSSSDFGSRVPANKLRIICSGDSMTFGTGVDNDHTWCQQLGVIDNRFETVNIAVPGYGVDQMYLHYVRDAAWLDHDVMIVAFIGDDFRRMGLKSFSAYAKPVLRLRNGQLAVDNLPAPFISRWGSLVARAHLLDAIFQLSSLRVLDWAFQRFSRPPVVNATSDMEVQQVAAKIFEALQLINEKKNSLLVLVYLPIEQEYATPDSSQPWRDFVRNESAKRGIAFFDPVEGLRLLPADNVRAFYIARGTQPSNYPSAEGHLSDIGNEYFARTLHEFLIKLPQVSGRLTTVSALSDTRPLAIAGQQMR